jgi:type II secretory pathway pseudopilin PulG
VTVSRRSQAGFGLVGAVATLTIMLTLMAMAMPAWRYVMQDDREEELIFRGSQIADALARWQRENKTLPGSLEPLVVKKYLRKAYKDPMSKHGRWRFIHPGDVLPPPLPTGATGVRSRGGRGGREEPEEGQFRLGGGRDGSQSEGGATGGGLGRASESGFGSGGSIATGPILGVASTSKAKSLRLFNGRSHYNEWIFSVGMPRIVGKMPLVVPVPGSGPGAGAPPRPVGSAPKR